MLAPIFLDDFEEADIEFINDLVDCVLATVRSFSVFEVPGNRLISRIVVASGVVEFVERDFSEAVLEV